MEGGGLQKLPKIKPNKGLIFSFYRLARHFLRNEGVFFLLVPSDCTEAGLEKQQVTRALDPRAFLYAPTGSSARALMCLAWGSKHAS